MKQNITALLIIQNEEKIIEKCLENLNGFVSDIVLVHDGPCNDKTVEIAKRYGCKVFIEPLRRNPEYLKNKYMAQHEKLFDSNYVFSFDADEELSPELKNELENLDLEKYDCYYIKRQNPGQTLDESQYLLRLFNVEKIRQFGFIHNAFKPLRGAKIKCLKHHIIHNHQNKNTKTNWLEIEAEGLFTKNYNFYNFSKWDKFVWRINLWMRKNIFLRKLYRNWLYRKYVKKNSVNMAKKRLEYYDDLTKELINYQKRH